MLGKTHDLGQSQATSNKAIHADQRNSSHFLAETTAQIRIGSFLTHILLQGPRLRIDWESNSALLGVTHRCFSVAIECWQDPRRVEWSVLVNGKAELHP